MASRIKGITIEIGGDVTGLDKALESTNKSLKNTQSQLKDVERLLKLDPGNVTLLEQQQRLLAEAIEETEKKLETLKDAEQQVQRQFERGEIGRDQYEALQREIASTEVSLNKLASEAKETDDKISSLDETPLQRIRREARNAADGLDDAADSAFDLGDALTAGAIIEGVKGLAGAVKDLNEETKEYRKIMASLEASSQSAGYTAQETEQIYKKLYGVLGDDQTAATTTANFQAMGLTFRELNQMVDAGIGAWSKYGDSIPIDGLAESVNESIRSGQVTGVLADVVNWGTKENETFGVTLRANTKANKEWNKSVMEAATAEDYLNLAMSEGTTIGDRAKIVFQALADQGLASMGRAWQENNKGIVEANKAEADFMDKTAEMAERLSPLMLEIQEGINGLLDMVLNLTENMDVESMAEMVSGLFDAVADLINFVITNYEPFLAALLAIGAATTALNIIETIDRIMKAKTALDGLITTFPALGNAIGLLTSPITGWIALIVAAVAAVVIWGDEIKAIFQSVDDYLQGVFLKDWTEVFGEGLGNALNGFMSVVKTFWDSIKVLLDGVIDFVGGVFTLNWEKAWNGVLEIYEAVLLGVAGVVKGIVNAVIGLLNAAASAINILIKGLNGINFTMPSWLGGGSFSVNLATLPSIPYLAKGGTLFEGSAIVGEAGPELLTVGNGRAVVQPLPGNTGRIESILGDISGQLSGGKSTPIVVQVTLDGKVIGETALNYSRRRARASGN